MGPGGLKVPVDPRHPAHRGRLPTAAPALWASSPRPPTGPLCSVGLRQPGLSRPLRQRGTMEPVGVPRLHPPGRHPCTVGSLTHRGQAWGHVDTGGTSRQRFREDKPPRGRGRPSEAGPCLPRSPGRLPATSPPSPAHPVCPATHSPCSFRRWKRGDPRKLFLMELSRVLQGTPPTLGLDGGVGLGVPAGLSLGVCTGVPLGVGRGLPLGEG